MSDVRINVSHGDAGTHVAPGGLVEYGRTSIFVLRRARAPRRMSRGRGPGGRVVRLRARPRRGRYRVRRVVGPRSGSAVVRARTCRATDPQQNVTHARHISDTADRRLIRSSSVGSPVPAVGRRAVRRGLAARARALPRTPDRAPRIVGAIDRGSGRISIWVFLFRYRRLDGGFTS